MAREAATLYRLLCSPISGSSHKARLESFYARQAAFYDRYRLRLLHGRPPLFRALSQALSNASKQDEGVESSSAGGKLGVWVDLGAGTGYNVELMAEAGLLSGFQRVYLVDLSPSLLAQAKQRITERGWTNVQVVEADATAWLPEEGPGAVDLVTFSYSLTMIPDWFSAIDHAKSLLKNGGLIGVCDFYSGRKYPDQAMRQQSWFTRTAWPLFFGFDNVNLSRDHVPYLMHHFRKLVLGERMGSVPYIPLVKCPYYFFIGAKRSDKTLHKE